METTKLRLAIALEPISAELARRAERGEFSDYESEHATPKIILIQELRAIYGTTSYLKTAQMARELERDVKDGKFDETREEAEAWFEREGKYLLKGDRRA